MKNAINLLLSIFLISTLAACGGAEKRTEQTDTKETSKTEDKVTIQEFTIAPIQSNVVWSGEVLGVYKHTGIVNIVDGVIVFEGNKLISGNFTVDLTSMTATDDNYNPDEGKTKEKLIEHLSSPDFFNVANHPQSSFEIISHDPTTNTLKGHLTIKNLTHEETVTDVNIDLENRTAEGKLVFDRKKYDVSFTHPAQDIVISDDVHLKVKLIF